MLVDISMLEKAKVLAALFNSSKAIGLGVLAPYEKDMTLKEAQELLSTGQRYFDYVRGRILKIDLTGEMLDTRLFDRDIGQGAGAKAITTLKQKGEIR
jgi:hypothetical protein